MLKIILTIVISLHKWGEIAIFPSRSFFCCLASKILLPREESLFSILTIVMMLVKSVLKFHYMQKFHQTTIRRIIPDGGCVSYLKLSSNHNPPRPDKSLHGVVSYPKSSSNHNLALSVRFFSSVVSYPKSSSNHNRRPKKLNNPMVVSYPKSSSNHNRVGSIRRTEAVVSYPKSSSNHNESIWHLIQ